MSSPASSVVRQFTSRPQPIVSSERMEAALKVISNDASQFEYKMKDLESKLVEGLSNFRTVDSLLQATLTSLRRNTRRADRSLNTQVPRIATELDESLDALTELSDTLPTIHVQVADIRGVYDSGREKAQRLLADLTWLNGEFYERWRTIIFTQSSPVSVRWKVFMRCLFAVSFILCSWILSSALLGGYRAYRHKLVWGERLMS